MENENCRQVEMVNEYIQNSHDISSRSRNDADEEHISFTENKEDFDDQSPIEQVALTVPTTDDPTIPVLTFRMWVLGILSCVLLSFLNQFFSYRREPIGISSIAAQIAVLPIGRLMAATITNKKFFAGSKWEFSLNPGPFNTKEHVLITIFASAGSGGPYAIYIVDIVKILYKKKLNFFVSLLVVMTTQVLGYGWAGIFRKYLVEPAAMWWPYNLVQVSLFRALHEKDERPKGGLTRNQFFMTVLSCSFAYYLIPGYLFAMVTSLSWICWAFPHTVLAHQLGSGLYGLGIGCLGVDWTTISSYLGSPLATPWFSIANNAVGFVIVMYVITPLTYWLNLYDAKTFPIFSASLFTSTGQPYDIAGIVDSNLHLDYEAYAKNGPIHLTTFFAFTYGVGFAALSATLVHVLLFHGKHIWQLSLSAFRDQKLDVHTRLMRKYKQVPELWFTGILVGTIALAIFACEYYSEQLQLPWWGVILACGIAFSFTLPIGVITATTNQMPGLNVITEYMIGYIYPGRPVASVCFKTYGYISMVQALSFLGDLKLGHYMKIPPRAMFCAQISGTVISGIVYLGTAWWLMHSIPHICDTAVLPPDSPWTCPGDHVFYSASVIWGLIGPRRIFGNLGQYVAINWFFLGGAIAPVIVWLFHKAYPKKEWIRLINMPILIGATGMMPPATAVNYTSWILMGFIFSFVVYRYKKDWWQRHNYVMSAGLDAGTAFMGLLLYFCLGYENIKLSWWGANIDGCYLAHCPTAKGINVTGCP